MSWCFKILCCWLLMYIFIFLVISRRGGSNVYPQSMFWSKNKKNRYTPAYPSFYYIKVGYEGVFIFLM